MPFYRLLVGAVATFSLVLLAGCGNIGPLYMPDDPHPPVYVPPKPEPVEAPAAAGSMSVPAKAHSAAQP